MWVDYSETTRSFTSYLVVAGFVVIAGRMFWREILRAALYLFATVFLIGILAIVGALS